MSNHTVRRILPRLLTAFALGAAISAVGACGGSVVTRPRLERSLPETFSNLYVQQAKLLGHQGVSVQSLNARAYCDKGGPKVADHGPGADWTCLMTWHDPTVPLVDGTGKFELNVHSNDCYTASGPSKIVGLLTITDTQGSDVLNPVFEFDSCFDPKGSNVPVGQSGTPAALTLPTGKLTPDATGQVVPELNCSTGAPGGCAGVLTAKVGSRTIGTVRYQLPPKGTNTFPFPLASSANKSGTQVTLIATPLIGTVRNNSPSLTVSTP